MDLHKVNKQNGIMASAKKKKYVFSFHFICFPLNTPKSLLMILGFFLPCCRMAFTGICISAQTIIAY